VQIAIDARELVSRPTGVGRYLTRLIESWDTLPAARAHRFTLLAHGPISLPPNTLDMQQVVLPGRGGTGWEQATLLTALRRLPPDVIGPLWADCAGDPDLRALFLGAVFDPPRVAVRETLERALGSGDLREDADLDLIVDMVGSLIHYRALFGHASTSDVEIERAVEALLQGIAVDYPRLLDHSRRVGGHSELHHLHA